MVVELCFPVAWVPSWPDLFRPSTSCDESARPPQLAACRIVSREGGSERTRKSGKKILRGFQPRQFRRDAQNL